MATIRVLVVDDDPFIRTTVSMLLKLEGYEVRSAADGCAGLQAARDYLPDLILSDLNMPYLDGYGLLAAVRADATLRATRFVLLTGEADAGQVPAQGDAPADGRLAKPFAREQLLGVLRSLRL